MKSIVIVAAAGCVAVSLGTSAGADPSWAKEPIASEQVSYADLDLSSAVGQKRLKDRISFAAYGLCLVDPGASPSPAVADPGCFRKAMQEGLAQMGRVVAAVRNHRTLALEMPERR